jgi:hypothetical protein
LTTRTSAWRSRGCEQGARYEREGSPRGSETRTEGGGGREDDDDDDDDDGDEESEEFVESESASHHQLLPLSVRASGVGSLPLAFFSER